MRSSACCRWGSRDVGVAGRGSEIDGSTRTMTSTFEPGWKGSRPRRISRSESTVVAGRVGDMLSGFMGLSVSVINATVAAEAPPAGGAVVRADHEAGPALSRAGLSCS